MQRPTELSLGLLLLAPFLLVLLVAPYMPNTDESWQLHAATRLASGMGYTTYWNVPEDLSGAHGDFLIAWPPGYSAIIAFLMKGGLSVLGAAKVFKAAAIAMAALAWLTVAQTLLGSPLARTVFLAHICATAVFFSFSPTDLFCWGIMGVLTGLMLTYIASGSIRTLAIASTLLASMILMRYHSLFLLPAVAIWCFFNSPPGKLGRIVRSVGLLLPAMLAYTGIALTNVAREGHLSTITASVVDPGVQWIWLRDLPRTLLLDGCLFELARLPLGRLSPWRAELESIVGWALLLGFTVILKRQLMSQQEDRRHLARWLSLCSIVLLLFLGFISVTRYSTGSWAPLLEGRFFWMLGPLILLVVLLSMEDLVPRRVQLKWQPIGAGAVLVGGLLAIGAYSIHRYRLHTDDALVQQNVVNRVAAISKTENADHTVVFTDAFVSGLLLRGHFPVYRDQQGRLPAETHFSHRTTLVWALEDPKKFAWRLSASMHSDSVGTKPLFYWKTFSPGKFSEQISDVGATK